MMTSVCRLPEDVAVDLKLVAMVFGRTGNDIVTDAVREHLALLKDSDGYRVAAAELWHRLDEAESRLTLVGK